MRRSVRIIGGLALGVGVAGPVLAQRAAARAPVATPAVLSAEELTSIRPLINGTPQWAPDGSRLMLGTAFAGSDLWTISAAGGFPASLNIQMGEIAFLQSHQQFYSPDGKWISYISDRSGFAELYLHSLADGHELQLTHMGARINSYAWAPDGHAVAVADDRYGNFDIYVVAVPSGAVTRLTTDVLNEVFPAWTPDSKRVVFVQLDDAWANHEVFVVDAGGKEEPRSIVKDTDFFDYGEGGAFGYPQVSPDGSTLLFRSHRTDWVNYWVVPMAGGTPRQIAADAADQSGARWSPDGKSILYLAMWNGLQDLRVVGAGGGASRVLVKPADMGVVANAAWSPDGSRVSYTLATPLAPPDLYVVPAAGGTPQRLTTAGGGAAHVQAALIRPKKISYPSADGLTIHAYLYEPIVTPGEKAPGILLIHGGPTAQFSDTYQEQAQYFAMRGYAVLLPNIRGATGYGKEFEYANHKCWGHCDLKDVVAGVAYLKQQPYIEPTRMGITGTSYGGIMSLCAAAFAPGVFQASIPASGYGDFVHFMGEQELRHIKMTTYELGPLPESVDLYRSLSPINSIDSIQTPIFLIHGGGLPGLPHTEASRLFADRLEMRYKPYKYKVYPNEHYYVMRPDNIRVMLGDMLAFFDQYLKDNAPPKETHVASANAVKQGQ